MRIGEMARQSGCDVETVRYYEKVGLLPNPSRNDSGYRQYLPTHLERLQFIRHCRSLQMRIPDIRALLELQAQPTSGCQRVDELLDHHIELIQVQMQKLQSLEQQLLRLRHQCEKPHLVQECGILQNLSETASINE